MKRLFTCKSLCTILFFVVLFTNYIKPCTSFAVYFNNTYYGLNLDWQDTEVKFSIKKYEGYKVFYVEFFSNGSWLTSCGFNERGLLSTSQLVYPGVAAAVKPNETPLDYGGFRISTDFFGRTDSLKTFLNVANNRLIQVPFIKLHSLIASLNGSAAVFESGTDSNMVTNTGENFIVMTNFNNHKFWGKPYTLTTGTGSDRYQVAYSYILQNRLNFTYENAWEVLKNTKQNSGSYPTICSFIFDPLNLSVYIAIKRNYQQIYKVSLTDNYIETYSGFSSYKKLNLTNEGILVSELINLTDIKEEENTNNYSFNLKQNYPNPFNSVTNISFLINKGEYISLKIYDILGNEIETLINKYIPAGNYSVSWNAKDNKSGIYFYKLQAQTKSITKKMIYLK